MTTEIKVDANHDLKAVEAIPEKLSKEEEAHLSKMLEQMKAFLVHIEKMETSFFYRLKVRLFVALHKVFFLPLSIWYWIQREAALIAAEIKGIGKK